jgi:oligopeptide/dipeptide ABC transporter ATP-binding protein
MYASKIVEMADTDTLFAATAHPYTRGLFQSLPRLGQKKERLDAIPGVVPDPLHFPGGCAFHPRCALTRECAAHADAVSTVTIPDGDGVARVLRRCVEQEPPLREIDPGHWCACWESDTRLSRESSIQDNNHA